MTGDGRADLVVVAQFDTPALQVLDVNGDQRNGVVVSDTACGVFVYLQGASGDFDRVVAVTNTGVSRIRFADVNSDGRLDAVTQAPSFFSDQKIEVRLQSADGSFGPVQTVALVTAADFAMVDINNDGRPDLVLAGNLAPGRNLAWAAQLAGGGFGVLNYLSHPVDANLQHLVVADLDGNGRLDIAAAAGYFTPNAIVAIFHQASDGSFGTATLLPASDAFKTLAALDMDGDGRLDLVASQSNRGSMAVYRQTQPKVYAAAQYLINSMSGQTGPAFGDLNGDGKTDFVTQIGEVAYFMGYPAKSAAPPQKTKVPLQRHKARLMTQR